MSDYNYEIIKEAVLEWYESLLSRNLSQYEIILSRDNEDALVIDFNFQHCIAQLSVTNSQYTPYQFVYFEAIDLDVDVSKSLEIIPIYVFFDDDTVQIKEVIGNLDEALSFCLNYNMK